MSYNVKSNATIYGASFSVLIDNSLAVSEVSFIAKESIEDYCNLITDKCLYQAMKEVVETASNYAFYNRLNVPEKLRGQGIGKELLKATLKHCYDNNILLLNAANNYGDMGQKNLIDFYKENGMTLLHKEGLLAYHKDLAFTLENVKSNKTKLKM